MLVPLPNANNANHSMKKIIRQNLNRTLRKARSRAKFFGTAERPRLSIFRSNKFTYAQLIDDSVGKTIASVSTMSIKNQKKSEAAKAIGSTIGEAAKKLGVTKIVFHKGAYKYHGRVAAVAEGAREAGLKF